jgi:tetratricopeptide (TPR) repeat protein
MDPVTTAIILVCSLALIVRGPIYLGLYLLHRERYRSALRCFRWLYGLTPVLRNWRGPAASYLAACYARMDQNDLARTYAEEAIRENKRRNYRKFLLSSQMHMGVLMSLEGEYEQAERLFDEALAEAPGSSELRRWAEIHAANTYLMRGRLDDAERLLHEVNADKRANAELQAAAHCIQGICHYYRSDLPAALDCAQQTRNISKTPSWVRVAALSDMLLYRAEMGDIAGGKQVEAELMPLLPLKPARLEQRAVRAVACLALVAGDLDRARDYAERAERLDPNPNGQAAALLIQAEVFAARHNAHRAVRLCETVLESNTIDFYKAKAGALRRSLLEPGAIPIIARPTSPVLQETHVVNIATTQTQA